HAMTAPEGSVIDTIVLLKVLLMCAWPCATFFFSLRRVFRAPVRVLGGISWFFSQFEVHGSLGPRGPERTTCGRPSSCQRRCAWDPCGFARWSWCADRGPGGHGGGEGPRSSRSRPCDGCPLRSRGGGHPRA